MENQSTKDVKIITVASGKGGVGKTNISLNLSLSLVNGNNRVCLLDADLGLANVDILLGMSPDYSLMDFIEHKCTLDDVLLDGPGSLKIVPGGSGLERIPEIRGEQMDRLDEVLKYFRIYDMLVVDTSAGISDQILYFLEAASLPIVVIIPEPTSFTDAYSLLKTYHLRGNSGTVYILVNQAKSAGHAKQVYTKFKEVVDKYLGISIKPVGYILDDDSVSRAVSSQTPFVQLFPDSYASRCVREIASRIISNNYGQNGAGNIESLFFPARPDTSSPSVDTSADPKPTGPQGEKYTEILDLEQINKRYMGSLKMN